MVCVLISRVIARRCLACVSFYFNGWRIFQHIQILTPPHIHVIHIICMRACTQIFSHYSTKKTTAKSPWFMMSWFIYYPPTLLGLTKQQQHRLHFNKLYVIFSENYLQQIFDFKFRLQHTSILGNQQKERKNI